MGTIGVALGGGGVLCAAELGVLQALRDMNVQIDAMAGTSGGGIIAGALAADVPLDSVVATWRMVCAHPDRWGLDYVRAAEDLFGVGPAPGAWTLRQVLEDLLLGAEVDVVGHWRKGYGVTATELPRMRALEFFGGQSAHADLTTIEALQATSAYPGVFRGVRQPDGSLWVDGGLMQDAPVAMCSRLGADHVLSVSFEAPSALPAVMSPIALVEHTVSSLVRFVQVPPPPDVHTVRVPVRLPAGAWLLSYHLFDALLSAGHEAVAAVASEIARLDVPF